MSNKSDSKGADGARAGLFIKTFGCQMNVYDSGKLAALLEDQYDLVSCAEEADLVLINTCSVRDKPEQKLYSMLGQMRELKAARPQLMVGVGGCVAQQEGERIISRSREVDFVFGTHNLSLVPSLIQQRRSGSAPQVAVDYRDEWEELPLGIRGGNPVSAFVSISRGCNKNCSYCIVPVTRGPEVSRDLGEIEREIRLAVHRGAREIVLLGQTVNSYGLDLNPRMKFVRLLERVAAIDGVARIRFTSPHPQEVRADFLDYVAAEPKVCRHIHMPLQSGSDRMLKAMNRNYRRAKYLGIIEQLKQRMPDIAVTTDIIVGFPGETEEDFQGTMELLETVRFDSSFSFMFSPRPDTKAAAMPDQIEHEVKLERLQRLQQRQDEITAERLAAWQGRSAEVLLEGATQADERCQQGRLSQNITVNLAETALELKAGMLVEVRINGAGRHTLKGELQRIQQPYQDVA